MRLLDTDILSHISDGTLRVIARLEATDDQVFTTVINQIELLQARYAFILKAAIGAELLRAQSWLDRSTALLAAFPVIAIDDLAARQFDSLRVLRRLRKIGRPDLLIAAVALAHEAVLVTRNVRDFEQIPNLSLENWFD